MVERRVFFSFKYDSDVWRANALRNQSNLKHISFRDKSLNEPSRAENEEYIKRKIRQRLRGTSVTVILVTSRTKDSKYVQYEYDKSVEKRNVIVQLDVSEIKDKNGRQAKFTGWLPYVHTSHRKKWKPSFRLDKYLDEKLG